jgi:streptomycin 6-kinase
MRRDEVTLLEIAVPDGLARTVVELYGKAGAEWLDRLPSIIADCARRWSLTILPPFEPLSYNYVAPAVRTCPRPVLPRAPGTDVVLKVGVPNPELLTEIAALQLYGGRGAVQLLEADPGQGALLLERLKPGTPLSSLADDEQATSIAAQVMQQLWPPVPAEHPFPTVARWAAGLQRLRDRFAGRTGPFPAHLVEMAEGLLAELIGSMAQPALLHGDLHHDNIRSAERQPWLALDPKGVVGEPAYEVGALLRNPMPQLLAAPHPGRVLARRVDQLAEELGFDRSRIVGWGLYQAVLSAWWSLEDHGHGWEWGIACAELLAKLVC